MPCLMVWGSKHLRSFQLCFLSITKLLNHELGPSSFSIILSLIIFSSSCLNCFSNANWTLLIGCCIETASGSVWSVNSPSNSPTLSLKTSENSNKISLIESSISNFLMSFRVFTLRSLHAAAETVVSNWSRLNRIKFSFWLRLQLKIGCTFSFTTMIEAITFLLLTGLMSSTLIVPSVLTFFPPYTEISSFFSFL